MRLKKPYVIDIITDTREQLPYLFLKYDCSTRPGTVKYGDYTLRGFEDKIAIERKSLDDFVGSICQGRERFEREIMSGGAERDFFAVVIEGHPLHVRDHQYKSDMNPHSVLQTAISWAIKYGVHFIWAGSRNAGEYQTYHLLEKYARLHLAEHNDSESQNHG